MGKVSDEYLLDLQLRNAFDGAEARFLHGLLDDHIGDWVASRREAYEPLLADLGHLAQRLLSNGIDYGKRTESRWADEVDPTKEPVVINTICFCGTRIQTEITSDGAPLQEWPVHCLRHDGYEERLLGHVRVDGAPDEPLNAQLVIQQAICHQEANLRGSADYVFSTSVKF
jgi:hypothetical protein